MLNWRLIGWATAAGAFLSTAGWGVYERSTRSKVEEDRERARINLENTVRTLAETQKGRDNFQVKLEALKAEQDDLSRRFVESQLRHRSVEDTWLSDKSSLMGQIDRLQDSLRRTESNLEAEKEGLQKEQSRRAQVEAQLAAERDAGKEAALRWNQELKSAQDVTGKQATEIQRANDSLRAMQGDLAAAKAQLQNNQVAVQQLEGDLDKTLNERDAAAVASQQTGQALNVAVNDLHRREMDVVTLQNAVGHLQRSLRDARQDAQQLERANQNLTKQVQQLSAQVKALTDQLNALKNLPRPPAPPVPAPQNPAPAPQNPKPAPQNPKPGP
jgi:chromosome segregation ATPase